MDGRDYIITAIKELGKDEPGKMFSHFVLNLPATAIEFMEVFREAFTACDFIHNKMPWIHCYCFSKIEDASSSDIIKHVIFALLIYFHL
jgi:tRNA (guanine37-N1)-methyltransferase